MNMQSERILRSLPRGASTIAPQRRLIMHKVADEASTAAGEHVEYALRLSECVYLRKKGFCRVRRKAANITIERMDE